MNKLYMIELKIRDTKIGIKIKLAKKYSKKRLSLQNENEKQKNFNN